MQIISGDAIDVTKGDTTVRGFALTDFESTDKDTEFELRRINKGDAIGAVVKYNTGDCSIKRVTDEKYSRDQIVHKDNEEGEK